MRTVTGPTDRVVIVGAGLAGLSAAMRLARTGREVTVLEREALPGGRCGVWQDSGYTIDTGPVVLTMPGLIEDAFDALGESMRDWVTLDPVEPAYRAVYPDRSTLDVHTDPTAMAEEIRQRIGPDEAAGYERFVDYVSEVYRLEIRSFIDANLDSPFSLLNADLARLVALGGFRRLDPVVSSYLKDPRTRRIFSFQALYAGLSPQRALALYSVIAYMDSVAGVSYPRGGMNALARGMAAAAAKHGVDFRYGVEVERVERQGRRATAVLTTAGERLPADVVVLNPDLPVARERLLDAPLRRPLRYSPSCVLMLAGSTADYPQLAHHTIHFGRAWRRTFGELIDERVIPTDPSFLVSTATRTDPTLAPAGRHTYYVLFMVPSLQGGQDWSRLREPFVAKMLDTLHAHGLTDFAAGAETMQVTTPAQWDEQGMAGGTPFALAHTFTQTGPFRPKNLWGENVVLTGSGTQPGVGVPMVMVSGRLAAERITGPDRAYRSRVHV
jgi:phytoene desaturase